LISAFTDFFLFIFSLPKPFYAPLLIRNLSMYYCHVKAEASLRIPSTIIPYQQLSLYSLKGLEEQSLENERALESNFSQVFLEF